jgi:hypothetical protein
MKASFSAEDIEEIRNQDFISEVGVFTSNQFKVGASNKMLGFYTELFFESVSDQFIDLDDSDFEWEEGDQDLPIILSRDYLALYNFGFAPSQGLPQFTPSTINRVSLDIIIRGKNQREVFKGNIIGFSDRINSVLVPQTFMNWANSKFGESSQKEYSRLILRTENAYGQELQTFLEDKGYEVSSGRLIGGELAALLKTIIVVVGFVGFVIVLLSLLVFLLNFQLVISQASRDIALLLQLGYPPKQISKLLINRVVSLFGLVLFTSFIILSTIRFLMVEWFENQGFELEYPLSLWVYIVAALFSVFFLFIQVSSIRKKVNQLFQ